MRQGRPRHILTSLVLVGAVAGMVGLAYASVPLYRLFCQVTGYGGTPGVAAAAPGLVAAAAERVITVRFDATVNSGLPWHFEPVQRTLTVRPGEEALAFYRARNRGRAPLTGVATFNVTPLKAGAYFDKLDCFCFTEQRLEPGRVVDMPVSFFIDPAIVEDRNLDDVDTITLSYTFFRAEGPVEEESAATELSRADETD